MFCFKCGKENPETGSFCWSCGNKLFKGESPSEPNSATCVAPALSAMRSGKKLVVPSGAVLPNICVKCGEAGVPHSYKFAWLDPGYYGLLLLGILPYFIIRLFLRKTVKLPVSLCDLHRGRTQNIRVAMVITLIGSIPAGLIVSAAVGDPDGVGWGVLAFFVLLFASLVLLWARDPLRATRIDAGESTFDGASEAFLRLLPLVPDRSWPNTSAGDFAP